MVWNPFHRLLGGVGPIQHILNLYSFSIKPFTLQSSTKWWTHAQCHRDEQRVHLLGSGAADLAYVWWWWHSPSVRVWGVTPIVDASTNAWASKCAFICELPQMLCFILLTVKHLTSKIFLSATEAASKVVPGVCYQCCAVLYSVKLNMLVPLSAGTLSVITRNECEELQREVFRQSTTKKDN